MHFSTISLIPQFLARDSTKTAMDREVDRSLLSVIEEPLSKAGGQK
jgi:hypothetical protein